MSLTHAYTFYLLIYFSIYSIIPIILFSDLRSNIRDSLSIAMNINHFVTLRYGTTYSNIRKFNVFAFLYNSTNMNLHLGLLIPGSRPFIF